MTTLMTAPWWIWRSVQTRLTKWTLLLLGGRKYAVELTTKIETGAHYPDLKRIEVNPEMFARESVEVQFRATQGLLLHEVGHARFTGAWPEQKDNVLCELVNMTAGLLKSQLKLEQALGLPRVVPEGQPPVPAPPPDQDPVVLKAEKVNLVLWVFEGIVE